MNEPLSQWLAISQKAMILIDTTPLVALCDSRDSLNKTALKHLQSLAKSEFAVCDPVLTEVSFHLQAPSQRLRLQQIAGTRRDRTT